MYVNRFYSYKNTIKIENINCNIFTFMFGENIKIKFLYYTEI